MCATSMMAGVAERKAPPQPRGGASRGGASGFNACGGHGDGGGGASSGAIARLLSALVGPVPPQPLEAILAATPSLTRDLTPETRQSILFILRGVALARLDSIGERQALDAIKTKTGLPIGDLQRQLAGFRREMGL